MIYAIRRADTRQLFAGFKALSLGKMEAKWTRTANETGCIQLALYPAPDEEIIRDIKRTDNIEVIFVPVTIGG